jgi:chorismate synthase
VSLRLVTAGESHGPGLVCIVEGLPAGLELDRDAVNRDMARRQLGHGRGGRMKIERDTADVTAGVRHGRTLGGPVALQVANRDYANWAERMNPWPVDAEVPEVHLPRPGHADLAGVWKFGFTDVRDVLERASARETAARVAAGAVARQLLAAAGVRIASHVFTLGAISLPSGAVVSFDQAAALPDDSPLRCVDSEISQRMIEEIDRAREAGDTLGGAFEVIADAVPVGLGSYVQWDRKLDGRLAQALMSIPAIKAVGVGLGPGVASRPGSQVHDELVPDRTGAHATAIARPTNNAGGLEGGVSNGEPLRVSAWMKPISTLMKPLRSVDLTTMQEAPAAIERSDVCAVPAAAIVGEAMVALTLADALVERFGGDSLAAMTAAMQAADGTLRARFRPA